MICVSVFKNEYVFGDCKNPKKIYYEKHHKTVQEVQRASVIRVCISIVWFNSNEIDVRVKFNPYILIVKLYVTRFVIGSFFYRLISTCFLSPFAYKDNLTLFTVYISFQDWLFDTWRIPTCIILRASSYESNAFRLTYYNFEICVPRVTFCYDKKRWNYYYYEWYIPKGITYGSDWDIYFYGPNKSDWTLQWG